MVVYHCGKKYNVMRLNKPLTMNETKIKYLIITLIASIFILITTLAIVVTNHRVQPVPPTKTIIITDTISKVVYDTIYLKEYKTVKLPVTDTIVIDSVKIDSIFVEVPISVYKLDTTFTTDTTNLNIRIQNSGYDVKLDTLYYRLEYRQAPPVVPKKNYFRDHFRFGIGVSAGYGFFSKQPDIFVGLGFYYVF